MSRLEELLQTLCPDGVEFFKLDDIIISLKTGLNPRKNFQLNTLDAKNYYVTVRELSGNKVNFFDKTDRVNDKALELINNRSNLEKNDILFSGTGTVGRTALVESEPTNWNIKEGVYVLKPKQGIIKPKYLLYLLNTTPIIENYKLKIVGAPVISLPMGELRKQLIPIPPLPVQEEIVRILDTFTALEAELESELDARTKQYEYYRDDLLDFDPEKTRSPRPTRLDKLIQTLCPNGVKYVELAFVSKIRRGVRVVRNQLAEVGDYPVFQNSLIPMGYYNDWNCPANSAFVISAGAAGEIGYSTVDFWAADDCFFFDCPKNVNNRFLYYFLLRQKDYLSSRVRRASVPRLSRSVVEQLKFPLPPLSVQEEIVAILDRFDALVNDLKSGLPAEIALRRKQYEYYRDKLLTFQPKQPPL